MATVREAATVMIVRDSPDLHVLMLRRTPHAAFVPGASVFPGGAVDASDRVPAATGRVRGLTAAAADRLLGLPAGGLGFWVAAVRESFEEGGVLLARDDATGERAGPDAVARLAGLRARLNRGAAGAAELLAGEGLVVDAGDLLVLSHWLTPPGGPRRYDTWFFVAPAPPGQEGCHDDDETVASEWVRPAEMLERFERREVELIFPTIRSLQLLREFGRAAALLDALRGVHAAAGGALPVVPGGPGGMPHGYGERVLFPDETPPPDGAGRWTIPLGPRAPRQEGAA